MEEAFWRIWVRVSSRPVRWTVVATTAIPPPKDAESASRSLITRHVHPVITLQAGLTVQHSVEFPEISEPLSELPRDRVEGIEHVHDAEDIVIVVDLGRDDGRGRCEDRVGFGWHDEGDLRRYSPYDIRETAGADWLGVGTSRLVWRLHECVIHVHTCPGR